MFNIYYVLKNVNKSEKKLTNSKGPNRNHVRFTNKPLLQKSIEIHVFANLSFFLKGVFAKNERGYRLNAIKKRF